MKLNLFNKAMFIITIVTAIFTIAIFAFFVPKAEEKLRDLEFKLAKNELSKVKLVIANKEDELKNSSKIDEYRSIKWDILNGLMNQKKRNLLKKLRLIINNIKTTDNGCLCVFNKNGRILIHSDENREGENMKNIVNPNTGNSIFEDFIKASSSNGSKLEYIWDKPNDKGNFSYKKTSWIEYNDYFGWYIASSVYYSDVNNSSIELKKYIFIATIIVLIFALLIGFIYIRRIFLPLQKLSKNMVKVKNGNYNIRFTYESSDEIGALAKGFNEMLEKIENNIKTLDKKVKERTIKFQKQYMELNKTQKQLMEAEKLSSLGGLVAGVAHEINTPVGMALTGTTHLEEEIQKLTSLYKDEEMSEDDFSEFLAYSAELTSSIETNLQRAASLVKGFKQVAVDQSSDEDREFLLKEYIEEEILTSLHNTIKKTKHHIIVNIDEKISLDSNPGAFSQILTNFIMNSIKHAYNKDEQGEIKIIAKLKKDRLLLIYKDDGKGMDKETVRQVFDPFFTTSRGTGGSGLGMHITYNLIVNKLNGTIKCESKIGQGVEFIMEIPI